MTGTTPIVFDSVEEFLTHAHALEHELAQRYEEMAVCMEVHNNMAVSTVFRQLSQFGETYTENLAKKIEKPSSQKVPPWDYQWLNIEGTEYCMEDTHYLMTRYQALEMALRMEEGSRRFYALTIQGTTSSPVKKLSAEMLAAKQQHLSLLNKLLSRVTEGDESKIEDLDPPNMPE